MVNKKHFLNIKYEPDFEVLGIFTGIKNYRLCWLINEFLSIKFKRLNDILITPFRLSSKEPFSLFFYKNNELQLDYYLLNNRSGDNILLPEPKNIDFLLLLKATEFRRIEVEKIVKNLRNIPQISTAIRFSESDKVKNLNSVLYDFELAMVEK